MDLRIPEENILLHGPREYDRAISRLREYAERYADDSQLRETDVPADELGDTPYRCGQLVVTGDLRAEDVCDLARLAVATDATMMMCRIGARRSVLLAIYRDLSEEEERALADRMQADARMGGAA